HERRVLTGQNQPPSGNGRGALRLGELVARPWSGGGATQDHQVRREVDALPPGAAHAAGTSVLNGPVLAAAVAELLPACLARPVGALEDRLHHVVAWPGSRRHASRHLLVRIPAS